MSTYRKTWACCGDITITDGWKPTECPFCEAKRLKELRRLAAPEQTAPECVICGATEPHTGSCGSNDARALCRQLAPTAPVAVFDGYIDGTAIIQWRGQELPAGTLLYAAPVAAPAPSDAPFIPRTPEQMIEFIGSNFGGMQFADEGGKEMPKEDVTYTLTVHDLLSAFDWAGWYDAPAPTEPADTRAAFEAHFALSTRQAWRTMDGAGYQNTDVQKWWEGWQAHARIDRK